MADALIQRSTSIELLKVAKSKHQKRTHENYGQARVIDIEVIREREAKIADKAM